MKYNGTNHPHRISMFYTPYMQIFCNIFCWLNITLEALPHITQGYLSLFINRLKKNFDMNLLQYRRRWTRRSIKHQFPSGRLILFLYIFLMHTWPNLYDPFFVICIAVFKINIFKSTKSSIGSLCDACSYGSTQTCQSLFPNQDMRAFAPLANAFKKSTSDGISTCGCQLNIGSLIR